MVLLPRFSAASVLEAIESHRVTLLSVVPTMLHALLDADERGILSRLRAVLCGEPRHRFPFFRAQWIVGSMCCVRMGLRKRALR